MKHIEINVGYACNLRCIFCMSGKAREKISGFESYDKIIKDIKKSYDLGYDSIGFLGGEPTIHPKFLEIVFYAKTIGFSNIEIVSNGSKFGDMAFLLKSVKNGLTRVSLSMHSIIKNEEKKLIGGVGGIYDEKIKSIKNIIKLCNSSIITKELSINIVISKINYLNIKKTILFLYKIGVKSFRLNFIQLEGYSLENIENLAIKYEDFKDELGEILYLKNKYSDIKINFEAIPWCFSGLNYKDYILFCEKITDFNKDKISRDDIDLVSRDIINQGIGRKKYKVYLEKCKKCFLKEKCEGIWKRYVDYFKLK